MVLFNMLYKVVLTFESTFESLNECNHKVKLIIENES